MNNVIDNETKIWAAGAFDGEGSIIIQELKNYREVISTWSIRVSIGNTDPRLIELFYLNWGGRLNIRESPYVLSYGKNAPIQYILDFNPQEAKTLLLDLFHLLKTKQEPALIVLRAFAALERIGGGISSISLQAHFEDGVRKGLWGHKKDNYNAKPVFRKALSSERLLHIVDTQSPSTYSKKRRILDKETDIEYKSRLECGLALALEYHIKPGVASWRTIYKRSPERFKFLE